MRYTYSAEKLANLPATTDSSKLYWRAQARKILAGHPEVKIVEVVLSGNKMDSQHLTRGCDNSPEGIAVVIASTGGKYGKTRRNYYPAA